MSRPFSAPPKSHTRKDPLDPVDLGHSLATEVNYEPSFQLKNTTHSDLAYVPSTLDDSNTQHDITNIFTKVHSNLSLSSSTSKPNKYAHVKSRVARYIKGELGATETKSPKSKSSLKTHSINACRTSDPELRTILNNLVPGIKFDTEIEDDKSELDSVSSSKSDFEQTYNIKIPIVKLGHQQGTEMVCNGLWQKKYTFDHNLTPKTKSRPATCQSRAKSSSYLHHTKSTPVVILTGNAMRPKSAPGNIMLKEKAYIESKTLIKLPRPTSANIRLDLQANLISACSQDQSRPPTPSRPTSALKIYTEPFACDTHSISESMSLSVGPWIKNVKYIQYKNEKPKNGNAIYQRYLELSKPRIRTRKYSHESKLKISEKIPLNVQTFPLNHIQGPTTIFESPKLNTAKKRETIRDDIHDVEKNLDFLTISEGILKASSKLCRPTTSTPRLVVESSGILKSCSKIRRPTTSTPRQMIVVETSDHEEWTSRINSKFLNRKQGQNVLQKRVSFSDNDQRFEFMNYKGENSQDLEDDFGIVEIVSAISEPKIQISRVGW
jgi:hypothetical protein